MAGLEFLLGASGSSVLDSVGAKLRQSQGGTVNQFIEPQKQQQIVSGALSAAEGYAAEAGKSDAKTSNYAATTDALVNQGMNALSTGKDAALKAAELAYRKELEAANLNNKSIQDFKQTYGSETHKKLMKGLYEQQSANAQELLAAQNQQDQGGFFNWIGSQFKAELVAEEAHMTDATINQLKANEMQATQQLAMEMQNNVAQAAGLDAEETARNTMIQKQQAAIIDSASKGLGFNREQFAAELQVIGMKKEVVNAAMSKLDALIKTNDWTTSAVQAEYQSILKDTAKVNLEELNKKIAKSELLKQQTEQDFQDYQIRLRIPDGQRRTYEQMQAEQEGNNMVNPLLEGFALTRASLATPLTHMATSTAVAYESGAVTPEVVQTSAIIKKLNSDDIALKRVEWLEKKGLSASNLNMPDVAKAWAEEEAKYQIQDPRTGKFNRGRLAELDAKMKQAAEFANENLDSATKDGFADLSSVEAGVKAQSIREQLLQAGADPEIAKVITDKIADRLPLDIKSGAPARDEVTSNIEAFLGSFSDEEVMSNNILQVASGMARYQAKVYQTYRASASVKSQFPNWRQSLIPGDRLSGQATINLEDAGSLSLLYREAIIKRRAKITSFNTIANKFLTERY